ncbi:MAG: proline--tRNA ligase [Chloroflexota bacterium]|nr:proline--tRNA ligase [Chloroflexota bacterium]
MRMTRSFATSLREDPSEAEIPSHKLLLRAGFIRQLGAGIFTYLPLARRAMSRIENMMREEIDQIGGQELTMPVVHPADVWQETGRWSQIGDEMARFKDRSGHDMVLAMTHEEVVTDLARREIQSYRHLPQLIYQIQTKFRDDPRPRAGLIRVREFTMLDSYSLDKDWEGLDEQYQAHFQAYFRIFNRCGLPVRAVGSDTGMMGGKEAHEYMYLTPVGEDTLMFCDSCDYAANRQVADFGKPMPGDEALKPLEKVSTPGVSTITDLAGFLDNPPSRTAKAVFFMAETSNEDLKPLLVFAVLRGDMALNETKLVNALAASGKMDIKNLRPAADTDIQAVGAVPGFASPIGIKQENVWVVVDDLLPHSPNLVAGANEVDFHLRNTNLGRDYDADIVADIAMAEDGASCPNCDGHLQAKRGVEVGNIFKLGTRYTDALGATFLDKNGKPQPIIMGSYGIGVGRLLACVAEEYHDDDGLIWPVTIAPYPIHLVVLPSKDSTAEKAGDQLYHALCEADLEPLYDDRDERAGVKFNDADLIGLPLRITVSSRSLQNGGFEFKRRDKDEKQLISAEDAVLVITEMLDEMEQEIRERFEW